MKKFLFIASVALLALTSCHKESTPATVKIMSYNIHNGIGLDKITDYNRIGELIKELGPDVVAIQEIDSVTARSDGKYVLGEIAASAGMLDYFAPAIDYRGGKYGIGILCKEEPLFIKRIPMPGREEERALIVAEFDKYVFACTHLSLTEEDRNASALIISELADEYTKPFFIAGDFNAEPGSTFINKITEKFTPITGTTVPTFPADTPNIVIDYIMLCNKDVDSISTSDANVIEETIMSDHRPIIVTATIP